jgi:hypothetical protein
MRALLRCAVIVAGALVVGSVAPASAAPVTPAAVVNPVWFAGADISWPECPTGTGIPERPGEGKPMPADSTRFVVLGLTNGPGWTLNPCLASQVAWLRAHHTRVAAYAITTYPTPAQLATYGPGGPWKGTDLLTRLRNAGFAEAGFNIATMRTLGISTPMLWVDVEKYSPWDWSTNHARNQAVLAGAVHRYRAAGYRVGFYSNQYMWGLVVGTGGFRGYPEWHTVGARGPAAAEAKCSFAQTFQGGPAVLSQWWIKHVRDFDLVCPAYRTTASVTAYFSAPW